MRCEEGLAKKWRGVAPSCHIALLTIETPFD